MSETRARVDRRGRFDWLTLSAAFLSFVLTVNLSFQAVRGDWGVAAAAGDAVSYWVVAGVLIAVQLGLLVRGIARGRGGLVLVALIALLIAVGASLGLWFPRTGWPPPAPAHTLDPGYRPCYSGSGDCVGG